MVKTYDMLSASMAETHSGTYVTYSDYQKLEASHDKLVEINTILGEDNLILSATLTKYRDALEELRSLDFESNGLSAAKAIAQAALNKAREVMG